MAGQWPGWQADYVIGREMIAICSPARLAARRAVGLWDSPAGLLGEPLLYHANGQDNWDRWFEAAGVRRAPLKLASGFDQVSILVRAVMADMGVAVLQRCLVQDDLQAGRVAAPFPDLRIAIARGYHLCAPRNGATTTPWPVSASGFSTPPDRIPRLAPCPRPELASVRYKTKRAPKRGPIMTGACGRSAASFRRLKAPA